MNAAIQIVREKNKFPIKLRNEEGEILTEYFDFDKKILNEQNDVRDIKYRYTKEIDGNIYILLEEFMFKDGETELDVMKSIGRNYYLNKK